ncbi:hypothetical protein SPRG_22280 [Saprolegnia parasitica CBS 223.65]|uniref:Uncharacterized protein n=1 Tax=Saprolegnia parasitica (strain CBS 223.65) TaxID=695850 RepID=A0A067C735_SAPPC|nr:hypothetical protein SPRG_22280 [Saprolegnia parasitica CBS 223.65]KDO22356.1 hypothetical protein SPRG_22280 [Saprolegnia parasitica CBS 223.65]|eukprot:XP_012206941.1 hypothetical protein SPRG_22280 [Saprolegnia parasitica CBS 223.65]
MGSKRRRDESTGMSRPYPSMAASLPHRRHKPRSPSFLSPLEAFRTPHASIQQVWWAASHPKQEHLLSSLYAHNPSMFSVPALAAPLAHMNQHEMEAAEVALAAANSRPLTLPTSTSTTATASKVSNAFALVPTHRLAQLERLEKVLQKEAATTSVQCVHLFQDTVLSARLPAPYIVVAVHAMLDAAVREIQAKQQATMEAMYVRPAALGLALANTTKHLRLFRLPKTAFGDAHIRRADQALAAERRTQAQLASLEADARLDVEQWHLAREDTLSSLHAAYVDAIERKADYIAYVRRRRIESAAILRGQEVAVTTHHALVQTKEGQMRLQREAKMKRASSKVSLFRYSLSMPNALDAVSHEAVATAVADARFAALHEFRRTYPPRYTCAHPLDMDGTFPTDDAFFDHACPGGLSASMRTLTLLLQNASPAMKARWITSSSSPDATAELWALYEASERLLTASDTTQLVVEKVLALPTRTLLKGGDVLLALHALRKWFLDTSASIEALVSAAWTLRYAALTSLHDLVKEKVPPRDVNAQLDRQRLVHADQFTAAKTRFWTAWGAHAKRHLYAHRQRDAARALARVGAVAQQRVAVQHAARCCLRQVTSTSRLRLCRHHADAKLEARAAAAQMLQARAAHVLATYAPTRRKASAGLRHALFRAHRRLDTSVDMAVAGVLARTLHGVLRADDIAQTRRAACAELQGLAQQARSLLCD